MEARLIKPIVATYLIGMLLFWFMGEGTDFWNVFFYSIEKLFSASGFFLLSVCTYNTYVKNVALYAVSICLFTFMYYIFCMIFGHNQFIVAASFLFYSLIVLYLIARKGSI